MGNKSSSVATGGVDAQALAALLRRASDLSPAHFSLAAAAHHGVPSSARAIALCGRQGLLALGTASGAFFSFFGTMDSTPSVPDILVHGMLRYRKALRR